MERLGEIVHRDPGMTSFFVRSFRSCSTLSISTYMTIDPSAYPPFTEAEAQQEIRHIVEALSDFPAVPKGSRGSVVKATRGAGDGWVAVVEWDLPREASFIAAMVLDVSVNVVKRSKPIADQFSRSEYETLVRILRPESRS